MDLIFDTEEKCLTWQGIEQFTQWFNTFKDPETEKMGWERLACLMILLTGLKGD